MEPHRLYQTNVVEIVTQQPLSTNTRVLEGLLQKAEIESMKQVPTGPCTRLSVKNMTEVILSLFLAHLWQQVLPKEVIMAWRDGCTLQYDWVKQSCSNNQIYHTSLQNERLCMTPTKQSLYIRYFSSGTENKIMKHVTTHLGTRPR